MAENPKDGKFKNLTDEELVQLSIENKENYYYLIKRYEVKLMHYIHRLTNITQQESEDILQDIFIKVYCNLNGFNQKMKFSSWIYRITRNVTINYYHKNKYRLPKFSLTLNSNDVYNLSQSIDGANDPGYGLIVQEKADKIKELLSKLPNKYREVLVLRYLEGKSYEEISDILRKPPGTVATLINRAKSKLNKLAKHSILMGNND